MTLVTKNKPGFMGPRDKEKLDYLSSDLDPALIAGSEPTLDLDFSAEGSVPDTVTFSRNSIGTYYDNKTVAKAEENLQIDSDNLGNYSESAITLTPNNDTAPNGSSTAAKIIETATTTAHYTGRRLSGVVNGLNYTVSVFFKKGSLANAPDIIQLGWDGIPAWATGNDYANFNLSTGAVTQAGPSLINSSILDVGNGWYRCSITFTSTATSSSASLGIFFCNNNPTSGRAPSYLGQTTADVLIWGPQLEQRDAVTAYIPTTTQPITKYQPVLLTAPVNKPRIDHDPITREVKGLLIEESRQNLVPYSEDFSNAAWTKLNSVITSNSIISPDGSLTADKFTADSLASESKYLQQNNIPITTNKSHTFSIYLKPAELHWALIDFGDSTLASRYRVYVDLQNGTFGTESTTGTPTDLFKNIISVGNGWYRVSISANLGAYTLGRVLVWSAIDDNDATYAANSLLDGIFIWGAQVEEGAFPTSYIPTSGSAVTRGADDASMTGTNFSDWFSQEESSIYVDSRTNADSLFPYIFDIGESSSHRIVIRYDFSSITQNRILSNVQYFGVTQTTLYNFITNSNLYEKTVISFKRNDLSVKTASSGFQEDVTLTLPNLYKISIGKANFDSNYLNGHIRRLIYWPKRLSNEILKRLSIR